MKRKYCSKDRYVKSADFVFRDDPSFLFRITLANRQPVTHLHIHEFHEVVCVISGSGLHVCEKHEPQLIKAGDVLIIPPGGRHAYIRSDGLQVANILFSCTALPLPFMELHGTANFKTLFNKHYEQFKGKNYPFFHPAEEVFAEIVQLVKLSFAKPPSPLWHSYHLGTLMQIISLICNEYPEQTETSGASNVWEVINFMQQNFTRRLSLGELCRHFSMSQATFLRHFRHITGMTTGEYLMQLRLKHASELLTNSSSRLKEIAESSGFANVEHFSRSFKKYFGTAPGKYRKKKNLFSISGDDDHTAAIPDGTGVDQK